MIFIRWGTLFLAAISMLLVPTLRPAYAQDGVVASWERPRIAVVVGVGGYQQLPQLANPVRDASLIAQTAQGLGFSVTRVLDPSRKALLAALATLREKVANANAIAMFYYAGHAVQQSGTNVMLPVDARSASDGVSLDEVFVGFLGRRADDIQIVILDACRNDPFGGDGVGLAKPRNAPPGTYVAYSAAPGEPALDGVGMQNSPYSAALARAMQVPGITIEEALRAVRNEVSARTNDQQHPWDSSSLRARFHFVPRFTIFPDSSRRLLSDAELKGLDCARLWIARNEIFHRHGYCFSTARGQDYFDNKDCTTPDQDVVKRQASGAPLKNIERIIVREARSGCRGGRSIR